jgi:opacity protein-like surface antigen
LEGQKKDKILVDGVYVGASLGMSYDMAKQKVTIDNNGLWEPNLFSKKNNSFSPFLQGSFGYQRVFKNVFMALEIGWSGFQKRIRRNGTSINTNPFAPNPVIQYSTQYRQDYTLFLIQKIGWKLRPQTGVYLKAGPIVGQFTTKLKVINHPGAGAGDPILAGDWVSHRKKLPGVELGAGVLHKVTEDWQIGFDVAHRRFQKIKHNFEPPGGSWTEMSVAPKETMALVTISRVF